jgi:ribonuclease BN (tRNA processing enzyme)
VARVTFLGSSDAFHSGGRRNAAYLVDDGATRALVDFGPTGLEALRVLRIEPASIHAVLLTHLHGDHIVGIPFLVMDGIYHSERRIPLTILGPAGTRARVDALFRATYDDALARPLPFKLTVLEIESNESTMLGTLRVEAFAAEHMDPPHRPLMFRLETNDRRILAFSGDTQWCDALPRCARGADLLVAECTGLRPPTGRHCTWEDWRAGFADVDARRIVLSHLGREVRERAAELRAALPSSIPLTFADDGLVLEI